jgi:flagellar basal body rod protein FlgB
MWKNSGKVPANKNVGTSIPPLRGVVMTIIFGKTLPELTEHLNYRNHRQEVISSNIANVDTPGYKAKETLFEKELESRLKLTTTDLDHVNKIS